MWNVTLELDENSDFEWVSLMTNKMTEQLCLCFEIDPINQKPWFEQFFAYNRGILNDQQTRTDPSEWILKKTLTDVFLKILEIDSDHMSVRRHNFLSDSPVGSHVTRAIHSVEYTWSVSVWIHVFYFYALTSDQLGLMTT